MSSRTSRTSSVHSSLPPPAPRPVDTAARSFFRNIGVHKILKPYDKRDLIRRALKVFLMAYPEFGPDWLEDNLYRGKLEQFLIVIEELYQVKLPNLGTLNNLWNHLNDCKIGLKFAVKKFLGRTFRHGNQNIYVCNDPHFNVQCVFDGKATQQPIELDINSEEQFNKVGILTYSFAELREARRRNYKYVMRLDAQTWNQRFQNLPLNSFRVEIGKIHPEGYQMKHEFGRGVQLVIEIYWEVTSEPQVHSKKPGQFHLHTIYRMTSSRLKSVREGIPALSFNKHMSRTSIVLAIRKLVTPLTDAMFWRTTTSENWIALQTHYETGVDISEAPPGQQVAWTVKRVVPYMDAQRSVTHGNDFEEYVCLCNEWCNWNAFFHYNPIYRFLLVLHNQLFLRQKINVPEMYLLAVTIFGSRQNPEYSPIMPLIYSANKLRKNYEINYLKSNVHYQDLVHWHKRSRPSPDHMLAKTYNILRNDMDVVSLCHQLHPNPLADICVKTLLYYYDILTDVHMTITNKRLLVLPMERERWQKEIADISRKKVRQFFKRSYDILFESEFMIPPLPNTGPQNIPIAPMIRIDYMDTMFGSDVEYLDYVPKNELESEVKHIRVRALRYGENDNVLNLRVKIDNFTNTFIHVYKFLTRVEPKFPRTYEEQPRRDMNDACLEFDHDFRQRNSSLWFQINTWDLVDHDLQNLSKEVHGIYTMKMFSFGFEIQKFCVQTRVKYLDTLAHNTTLVASAFQFIWNTGIMENVLEDKFHERLFPVDTRAIFAFSQFFDHYWPMGVHETNPQSLHTVPHWITSLNEQLNKIFIWQRADGDRTRKFSNIGNALMTVLRAVQNRSEELLRTQIIPLANNLQERYAHGIEVWDVMVVYLVRSACFVIMTHLARFFFDLIRLQPQGLCTNDLGYVLAKPGWVYLIRTRAIFWTVLDTMKAQYLVYDDECERIANTFEEVRKMVKHFYRYMYNKLTYEWCSEVSRILRMTGHSEMPEVARFLAFSLAIFIGFAAAFHDQYRTLWNRRRRWVSGHLQYTTPVNPIQIRVFKTLQPVVKQYLSQNHTFIRTGQPFRSKIWISPLQHYFPDIARLSPQVVGLDMVEANFD